MIKLFLKEIWYFIQKSGKSSIFTGNNLLIDSYVDVFETLSVTFIS